MVSAPTAKRLGRRQTCQSDMDLNFSMPKTASILALASGDERNLDENLWRYMIDS